MGNFRNSDATGSLEVLMLLEGQKFLVVERVWKFWMSREFGSSDVARNLEVLVFTGKLEALITGM